jgi:hypothetical protein
MTSARRPNLYVIAALKRKYGEAKGRAGYLLEDRAKLRTNMDHLAAVLAMFDPATDLAAIPAKRPYKPARGRWNRTALSILRKANRPLKAYEIARLVMSQQGVAPDRQTLKSIGCSLQAVFVRLEREGLVKATGKPRRWSISNSV